MILYAARTGFVNGILPLDFELATVVYAFKIMATIIADGMRLRDYLH